MKMISLSLIVVFLFTSCISFEYVKTGEEYQALPENEEVRVYLSKTPEVDYVEIGVIVLYTNDLEAAKKQARLVGGNALIKLQGVNLKFAIIKLSE